jgi:hypothetical protein
MPSVRSALLVALTVTITHAQAPPPQSPPTGTGLIVGQVVDAASGSPIPGAVATISGAALASSGSPPRIQALTGGDGRFVFRDLPKGAFTITATKGGYLEGAVGRRRPGGLTQTIELADGARTGVLTVPMWKHGVLSGTVVDEAGEPVIGIQVRVMRRAFAGGTRRFTAGPNAQTDDRGIYRIPGLVPGDYIAAIASTQAAVPATTIDEYRQMMQMNDPGRTALMSALAEAGAMGPIGAPGTNMQIGTQVQTLGRGATPPPAAERGPMFAYPTTFHPAALSSAQAAVVTIGSREERTGIDFQIKPVAMYRVSGVVMGPDGPAATVPVKLIPAEAEGLSLEIDAASTVTDRNGLFTLIGVPPGQYVLRITKVPRPAQGAATTTVVSSGTGTMMMSTLGDPPAGAPPIPTDPTLWALQPIAVGRTDVANVTIGLRTGLRVSGRVEFDGAKEKPTAQMLGRLPVTIEPIEGRGTLPGILPGRIDPATSQFTTYGLPGGRYFVRIGGAPPGWTFKSATYQGRDVSDVPLDLDASDAAGVVITFTDQATELSGTAQGARGGDPDATIIVFPSDNTGWVNTGLNPRRIRSIRSGPNGAYKVSGLPPGSYFVAAVPDESAGDWQDPRFLEALARSATQVTLDEGEKKTQNVRTTQAR